MSDAPHDPWDSLADALGAAPGGEPPPPRPAPPPRPRQERPAPRRPAPQPPAGDWDSLADELGLRQGGDATAGKAAAGAGEAGAGEARKPARGEAEAGEAEAGEGTGRRRRRRGRRGGRGRRRDDERTEGGERITEDTGSRDTGRGGDRPRRAPSRLPRPADDVSEGEAWREALEADFAEAMPVASQPVNTDVSGGKAPADEQAEDEGDRSRKRRRRGRRGGRSRGASRGDEPRSRGDRPPRSATSRGDSDDEPLPASYGSRSVDRDDAEPTESVVSPNGDADRDEPARSRGRRRRSRRSGGERRKESTAGQRSERPAARRERRRDESRPARGRRADFEPVAGRYEEDDEGLEFLGVEEAARSAPPRTRVADDDNVLAESGLTGVLDVPSWVEAIGIVIAGNLASRSRSGRTDGGKGR